MNIKELKQGADNWLAFLIEDEKSENSIKQYRRALDTFISFLEESGISEIDKKAVIDYKNSMIEEIKANQKNPKPVNGKRKLTKNSTLNLRLRSVNALFKYLGKPDLTVKPVKDESQNVLDDMLTEKEYKRLLDWADRLGKERIKLIMETLTGTGIRISELEGITVESLKGKNKTATVTNKGKTRKVFIPNGLAKKLRAYCQKNGIKSGIIFCSRDGSKLLDQTLIRKELKAIAGKARGISLKKVHPHTFRHLFAKRYANMPNGNPYILPMLLGHSDKGQSVTALYVKPTTQELSKIVNEMEAYYNAKK